MRPLSRNTGQHKGFQRVPSQLLPVGVVPDQLGLFDMCSFLVASALLQQLTANVSFVHTDGFAGLGCVIGFVGVWDFGSDHDV